jgi:hypothetical protein
MNKPVTEAEVESSLYDSDFYEWTQTVSGHLRNGRLPEADLEHIAEEIADMGKRDRRELFSRMTVLLMHLMKWAAQPERRNVSTWKATIDEQREQIGYILEDSPSLRARLIGEMPELYSRATLRASRETGMPADTFARPDTPRIDHLLTLDWYPESLDDL